jgi:hypothetical protein
MRRAGPVIATTVIVGFLLGAAISVLAFYVARYGPSGDNWSFKGNGALAVYPAFPAVMAAGWTGLVLHARGAAWLARAVGAGLIGLVIALIAAAILPVLGVGADQVGTPIALLALLAWTVAAPIAATRVRVEAGRARGSSGLYLTAGVLWFAAAAAGLVAFNLVIPAGS